MAASSKAGSHSLFGNSKSNYTVQSLQATFNSKYAATERLTSLKHPDEAKLNTLFGEIDIRNINLILALASERPENYIELIGRAQCNKEEFDTYKNGWFNSCKSSQLLLMCIVVLLNLLSSLVVLLVQVSGAGVLKQNLPQQN